MNRIDNISFGKQIPKATCSILNKVTKQPQKVMIYEHDCKGMEDYEYFKNLPTTWDFKETIAQSAKSKFRLPISNLGTKIYSMETESGKTVGIMETNELGKICTVEHLESHYGGLYSYIGTVLLAFLSKEKIKDNVSLIAIPNPSPTAEKFYTQHCFYEKTMDIALEANRKNMQNLVEKAEEKTASTIERIQK